ATRGRDRHRSFRSPARRRGDDRAQAGALRRRSARRVFCNLPRTRSRRRASGGAECAPVQPRIRGGNGMPARDRHRDRCDSPLADRPRRVTCRGGRCRTRGPVLSHSRGDMRTQRVVSALALALVLCPMSARAHLITTGLGPVYDGITHFALTPEDLLPALALAILAGLRGKPHARMAIFALPLAWLVAGIVGASATTGIPDSMSWLPLLVMGGLVAADLKLSVFAVTTIAVLLGLVLGYANGYAMAHA